jgi:CBS domain-containing protein
MPLMPIDNSLSWAPNLDDAIERHPLAVPPTTPLLEAITLIGQIRNQTSSQETDVLLPKKEVRTSCILVMENRQLLGILTERDIVRLTAKSIDFATTTIADVMIHPIITLPQRSVQDIFAALFLFRRYRIRHLPIVDDQEQLVGVISHESIRQILRPANLLRFRLVSDVMNSQVIHAPLTSTILQLAQLMTEERVSCVVITQPDGQGNEKPVGIVTERDVVQMQALQIDLSQTQAETAMSTPLFLLSPEDSLWTAHQEMQTRRVGRLVVSWNWGKGLGIVTQTSLLRVFDPMEMYGVIENLQQTIQQLATERSRLNADSELDASLLKALSSTPLVPAIDRARLSSLLQIARRDTQEMFDNLELTIDQHRSLLLSVLDALGQIDREIKF